MVRCRFSATESSTASRCACWRTVDTDCSVEEDVLYKDCFMLIVDLVYGEESLVSSV